MSTEVRVPSTGNADDGVVIAQWAAAEGDAVSQGDQLVSLETAKATVDVEAPVDGILLRIFVGEGDEVSDHAVIAVIGQAGEEIPAPGDSAGGVDAKRQQVTETRVDEPVAPATKQASGASGLRSQHKVSPRAAIMAERSGVDLASLVGTGPQGRIIVPDVIAASRTQPGQSANGTVAGDAAPPSATPATDEEFDLVPVRGPRKITAQRMHESLQSTAQVTLTRYADATRLFAYAARLKEVSQAAGRPRITLNDLLLFATAKAVAKHPEANATFDWDHIRRYRSVHLGFAVDTGRALLVPVIPNADSITLEALAEQAHGAIERASSGGLGPDEMTGGTFTVSNLGGLGIHWFTPVLNPPQSCILGIGAAQPAYPDGAMQLPLSLTFDHRALDGAAAARALAEIAQNIEAVDVLSAFSA